MYAITKYMGPTNHRGSRVKATLGSDRRRSITQPWESEQNLDTNHRSAVIALTNDLPYKVVVKCLGETLDRTGYVFSIEMVA